MIQKATFEEQAMVKFQQEKNYQIEKMKMKND